MKLEISFDLGERRQVAGTPFDRLEELKRRSNCVQREATRSWPVTGKLKLFSIVIYNPRQYIIMF